jgi:hypothetical protein
MRPRASAFLTLTVLLGACLESSPRPDSRRAGDALPAAPWHGPALAATAVPPVYHGEWQEAENRSSCPLIAPASVGVEHARGRAATFGGGWAVAYDLPELRSAFGVAGTGARAAEPFYDEWPRRMEWADGSRAGYGPEGGRGPTELAYLRVAGADCLYNVWSRLGVEHLEHLLSQLRFVEGEAG